MKAHFRPEFVNRVDDFVVFEALKLSEIKQIVRLQAKRVEDRLKDKKMRLELTDSAVDYLAVWPGFSCLHAIPICHAYMCILWQHAQHNLPFHCCKGSYRLLLPLMQSSVL